MVVLLLSAKAAVSVGPEAAARLARFGVGHAALLRDDGTVAVVLEGWAFDPERSAAAAAELIAPGEPYRVLQSLADLTVTAGAWPDARLPRDRREEP
jgi:hypothetical protein